MVAETQLEYVTPSNIDKIIEDIEDRMKKAADNLDFETAAMLRDKMIELKSMKSGKMPKKSNLKKKK
jgi:Helicase subunit of the DNA excision repair complex